MKNRLLCRDGSKDRGLAYQFGLAIGTGPILPMAHGRMVQTITIVCAKEIPVAAFINRISMVFHNGSPSAILPGNFAVNDVISPSRWHTRATDRHFSNPLIDPLLQDNGKMENGANTVYSVEKSCIFIKYPDQSGYPLGETVPMSTRGKVGKGLDFWVQM